MPSALDRFAPATRAWFAESFDGPTPAQEGAWRGVEGDEHVLVVAPTGSGKTLAAFLSAIDRLMHAEVPADEPAPGTRVLYISPLKALAVDVERNLRSPLVGITQAAARRGDAFREVTVGVRSGDTSQRDRRAPSGSRREHPRALRPQRQLEWHAGRGNHVPCVGPGQRRRRFDRQHHS